MTRRPFTATDRNLLAYLHGKMSVKDIAALLRRNPKVLYNYLAQNRKKLRPRYNDIELYMLQEFSAKNTSQFTNRTINALRIKKHRIRCKPP